VTKKERLEIETTKQNQESMQSVKS